MHKPRKSLYYFGHQSGINVYDEDNGTTTGCAVRPNDQPRSIGSIGSIHFKNSSGETFWLVSTYKRCST